MKKKILMIGVAADQGGVESYILNLIKMADASQYCFYLPKGAGGSMAYEDVFRSLGCVIVENCPSRHKLLQYLSFYKALFQQEGFDAVYLNTCDIMSYDMLIFAKKAGVPVRVIHSHCSHNMIGQNLYHKLSEKWCRANLHTYATHYFACGKQAGDWMFGEHPYTIIPNGIDTARFQFNASQGEYIRSSLGIADSFVLGFVGRLSPPKKPTLLVDIFAYYQKKRPQAHLLIVGEGKLRQETEAKIAEYGLQDKITMLGARSDIPDLMCAMDCFVLPSGYEGFPFVLVEAQGSGLPCIVSENVSKECDLLGRMQFIGLDDPVELWADAFDKAQTHCNREVFSKAVYDLGYDLSAAVKYLDSLFT